MSEALKRTKRFRFSDGVFWFSSQLTVGTSLTQSHRETTTLQSAGV